MAWAVAFVVILVAIAVLGIGAALHPVLYVLYVAAVLIVPVWLVFTTVNRIVGWILGKRG